MHEIQDLTPDKAVVAGRAIQGDRWLPEALRFVQTQQAALARKPFAAFLVCMTLALPHASTIYRAQVVEWLAPIRALVPPVSEGLFAGALDLHKIASWRDRLKFRLSVAYGVWTVGDHRDWTAIRAWVAELEPLLQEQQPSQRSGVPVY